MLPCSFARVGSVYKRAKKYKLENQRPEEAGHDSPMRLDLPRVPYQTPSTMRRSSRNRPSWKVPFTRLCPVRGTTLGPLAMT